MTTPKKPKLNIECIGSKTKKHYKHDLIGSPIKTIKSPKAKQVKGKKYHKKGHKVSTQTHDTLALN